MEALRREQTMKSEGQEAQEKKQQNPESAVRITYTYKGKNTTPPDDTSQQ
jgi:hypothetical protein